MFEDLHKYLEDIISSGNLTEEQRNQVASRMAKIEEQMPLVKGCIDYASDYGAFSDRMKKKTVNVIWNATVALSRGSGDQELLALKYVKLIYSYCRKDKKRILRDRYGYKELGVSEDALEPDEMNFIGAKYANGDGVPVDEEAAIYWIRKAAEAGNSDAQYNLGRMYFQEDRFTAVDVDYTEAKRWFQRSADQGNTNGMLGLGVAYAKDDDDRCKKWFIKAAAHGNENALKIVRDDVNEGIISQYELNLYGEGRFENGLV